LVDAIETASGNDRGAVVDIARGKNRPASELAVQKTREATQTVRRIIKPPEPWETLTAVKELLRPSALANASVGESFPILSRLFKHFKSAPLKNHLPITIEVDDFSPSIGKQQKNATAKQNLWVAQAFPLVQRAN